MNPPEALAFMSIVGCSTYVVVRFTNALVRRMELRHGAPAAGASARLTGNLEERLTRIEQAVDAIAVEVERISEGQRFTTKLLADVTKGRHALSARGDPDE
jgi:hypothetical protein